MLHAEPQRLKVARLEIRLGLTLHEASIVAALFDAGCAWLPAHRLLMALPDPERGRNSTAITRLIGQIRAKRGEHFILGKYGEGYTLGAPGVRDCRKALPEWLE